MLTILNLTAVPLGEDDELVDSHWQIRSISLRIGEHEIGRVPSEDLVLLGDYYQIEESVANWLAERLAR